VPLGPARPGPATLDATTTISCCPGGTVSRCTAIAGIPAILRPLPYVAVHLIEPPWIGLEGLNRYGHLPKFVLGPRIISVGNLGAVVVVSLAGRDLRSPPERRCGAGAREAPQTRLHHLRRDDLQLGSVVRHPCNPMVSENACYRAASYFQSPPRTNAARP
jgi:hypothetical protein